MQYTKKPINSLKTVTENLIMYFDSPGTLTQLNFYCTFCRKICSRTLKTPPPTILKPDKQALLILNFIHNEVLAVQFTKVKFIELQFKYTEMI